MNVTEATSTSRFTRLATFIVSLLVLGALIGPAGASAEAPTVVLNSVDNATYTSFDIQGEVDPLGQPIGWYVEVSTDGENFQGTALGGEIDGTQVSGPQAVNGTVTGVTAGQTYYVRLVGYSNIDFAEARSAQPYPQISTDAVNSPTVTIEPVTTFTARTAQLSGHINPNPLPGDPDASDVSWHFECTPECPGIGEDKTVDAADGETTVEVDAAELEPNTHYEVRLIGKNAGPAVSAGPVEFTTDAEAPEVQTLPAFAIRGGTEALVGGSINPRNSETTYWVEWGPTDSYGSKFPLSPNSAGSSGQLEYFTQRLTGLTPSTRYHLRLVAENDAGQRSEGSDQNFQTAPSSAAIKQGCPNASLRVENNSTTLPNCRAYEMVSPPNKNGLDAGIGGTYIAAADGERLAFETPGALPGSEGAFVVNENVSSRTSAGWSTKPILPGRTVKLLFPVAEWFASNLEAAALSVPAGSSLAPGDVPSQNNLYLRSAAGEYRTLNGPSPTGENPEELVFAGATEDASHVVFEATGPLTPEAPPRAAAQINTYERVGNQLRLVSILPKGEPAPNGTSPLGRSRTESNLNVVSDDGSRIVFETVETEPPTDARQLYVRENGERTIEVSASERDVPDPRNTGPTYWGASADGSKVIFSAQRALTNDARLDSSDLYSFDVDSEELTDLTVNHNPGEGTSVLSGVVGISEDASYVYFISPSQFVSGKGTAGEDNLYLWHDGAIRFIETGSVGESTENGVTARTSTSGRYFLFLSSKRLTAYDNTDADSGSPVSEVYRYDAAVDELTCVSCDPSGISPDGSADMPIPPTRQLTNRQRSILDDGTALFTTTDSLLPADSNGKADLYAFNEGQVRLISSGTGAAYVDFASASADGGDIFFSTSQPLVPADTDASRDVYDARVGGGFPSAVAPTGCVGDECQGQGSAPPPAGPPGSAILGGETRRHLSGRARLRGHLRSCRSRMHTTAKRRRCEARTKRRFGAQSEKSTREAK